MRFGCPMKTLPFVVQPKKKFEPYRVGTEEIGFIDIERRGYLTVSEKSFVESVMQGSDSVSLIISLANKISAKLNIRVEIAYSSIVAAMGQGEENEYTNEIRANYSDSIASIVSEMANAMEKRSLAAATILIQSRIDRDWTVEETLDLDPLMVEELAKFYDLEEARNTDPQEDALTIDEETVSEIVGKSKEENGESPSTSKKSSGN
jgi:hypothetical protein